MDKIQRIADRAELSEKSIERYLADQVELRGGLCLKYSNATATGFPDRMILTGGHCVFVELKSAGRRPTRQQALRHEQLRRLGFAVFVIDRRSAVDEVVNLIFDL